MTLPLIAKVGGPRNAALIMTGVGGVVVFYIGHRHSQKTAQSAGATPAATGYADTSMDPTQVYTGYDQLQQEISALQAQSGVPNPNPVPVSTSPGTPSPPAPIPRFPFPVPRPVGNPVLNPVLPPSSAPGGPAPKSYKVVKGDTLSGIAQRVLGSSSKWPTLYAENKAVIGSNPDLIRPGEVLRY